MIGQNRKPCHVCVHVALICQPLHLHHLPLEFNVQNTDNQNNDMQDSIQHHEQNIQIICLTSQRIITRVEQSQAYTHVGYPSQCMLLFFVRFFTYTNHINRLKEVTHHMYPPHKLYLWCHLLFNVSSQCIQTSIPCHANRHKNHQNTQQRVQNSIHGTRQLKVC